MKKRAKSWEKKAINFLADIKAQQKECWRKFDPSLFEWRTQSYEFGDSKRNTPNTELITPNYLCRNRDAYRPIPLSKREIVFGKGASFSPLSPLFTLWRGCSCKSSLLLPWIIKNKNSSLPCHQRGKHHGGRNRQDPFGHGLSKKVDG